MDLPPHRAIEGTSQGSNFDLLKQIFPGLTLPSAVNSNNAAFWLEFAHRLLAPVVSAQQESTRRYAEENPMTPQQEQQIQDIYSNSIPETFRAIQPDLERMFNSAASIRPGEQAPQETRQHIRASIHAGIDVIFRALPRQTEALRDSILILNDDRDFQRYAREQSEFSPELLEITQRYIKGVADIFLFNPPNEEIWKHFFPENPVGNIIEGITNFYLPHFVSLITGFIPNCRNPNKLEANVLKDIKNKIAKEIAFLKDPSWSSTARKGTTPPELPLHLFGFNQRAQTQQELIRRKLGVIVPANSCTELMSDYSFKLSDPRNNLECAIVASTQFALQQLGENPDNQIIQAMESGMTDFLRVVYQVAGCGSPEEFEERSKRLSEAKKSVVEKQGELFHLAREFEMVRVVLLSSASSLSEERKIINDLNVWMSACEHKGSAYERYQEITAKVLQVMMSVMKESTGREHLERMVSDLDESVNLSNLGQVQHEIKRKIFDAMRDNFAKRMEAIHAKLSISDEIHWAIILPFYTRMFEAEIKKQGSGFIDETDKKIIKMNELFQQNFRNDLMLMNRSDNMNDDELAIAVLEDQERMYLAVKEIFSNKSRVMEMD
jgi:hypothetical protein